MNTVLTIAGSDSIGGAGVQADLKTATALGVYATCVVTAVTAQNADMVWGYHETPADMVSLQLEAVRSQLPPDAVKIGMVPSAACVHAIVGQLKGRVKHFVIDPLALSSGGQRLASEESLAAGAELLYPLAQLLTPNRMEAAFLTGGTGCLMGEEEAERAARILYERYGCGVLIKGGHAAGGADDLLFDGREMVWLRGERLPHGAHGTGCTLSTAIACYLAKGAPLRDAVLFAKRYLTEALRSAFPCGRTALLHFSHTISKGEKQ